MQIDWIQLPQWRLFHDDAQKTFFLKVAPTAEEAVAGNLYGDSACSVLLFNNSSGKLVGYQISFKENIQINQEELSAKLGCFGFGGFVSYLPIPEKELPLNDPMVILFNDINLRILKYGESVPIYFLLMRYNSNNDKSNKIDIENMYE